MIFLSLAAPKPQPAFWGILEAAQGCLTHKHILGKETGLMSVIQEREGRERELEFGAIGMKRKGRFQIALGPKSRV